MADGRQCSVKTLGTMIRAARMRGGGVRAVDAEGADEHSLGNAEGRWQGGDDTVGKVKERVLRGRQTSTDWCRCMVWFRSANWLQTVTGMLTDACYDITGALCSDGRCIRITTAYCAEAEGLGSC